jgi:hypothetical protein
MNPSAQFGAALTFHKRKPTARRGGAGPVLAD